MDFTENHRIVERPSEPAAEHDQGSPADRTWPLLPPLQESHMSPNASERQNEGPLWDSACLVDPTGNETRSVYYREEPSTPDPSPFENWSDDSPDERSFGMSPGISTPRRRMLQMRKTYLLLLSRLSSNLSLPNPWNWRLSPLLSSLEVSSSHHQCSEPSHHPT